MVEVNREFMTNNGSYSWNDPRYVCVHYTGGAGRAAGETARNNAIYYQREGGNKQVGAHYFIGDDGVYASTPEDRGAWTQGNYNANHSCISFEVVGSEGEGFSETEIRYLTEMVRDVMNRYLIPPERVIRHHDVADVFTGRTADAHKLCPYDYVDDAAWRKLRDRITGYSSPETSHDHLVVDGWFGPATVMRLQEVLGTTADGFVSQQAFIDAQPRHPNEAWEYVIDPVGGSDMVKSVQRALGVEADGFWGNRTTAAFDARMGASDHASAIRELQRRLNEGRW